MPIIACGGAGKLSDFGMAVREGGASAAAAGSFFIFHGKRKAVLITYPSYTEISDLFN
jgi:cyclase